MRSASGALNCGTPQSLLLKSPGTAQRRASLRHPARSGRPTLQVPHLRPDRRTKTRKSRRTLELPQRCADALRLHREHQDQLRKHAGANWHDNDLVFTTRTGTALGAGNVRRAFRTVAAAAGLNATGWTPRELRHSFVSLMPDAGVPIEKIAGLSATSGRLPRRLSTASRSVLWSQAALRSWTGCSPSETPMLNGWP